MTDFSKGDRVEWNWGNGTGTGTIAERFTDDVERTIKGSKVSRNASKDDPAFLIEQDDGAEVLKSSSELSKTGSDGSDGSDDGRTKDELYEQAKKEDVEGRSTMSKAELADAVED